MFDMIVDGLLAVQSQEAEEKKQKKLLRMEKSKYYLYVRRFASIYEEGFESKYFITVNDVRYVMGIVKMLDMNMEKFEELSKWAIMRHKYKVQKLGIMALKLHFNEFLTQRREI